MIEYLVLIIILFYFIISSIEDIKKREVYDYFNFSLSYIILIIAIFHSFLINSIEPIKYVGFGFILGFAIGSVLYYMGIWGGGDSKFLIGFSASSYYLINFIDINSSINIYSQITQFISIGFNMFINTFLNFILILDLIFLIILIFSRIFIIKDKLDKKNIIYLFYILLLLFLGLYLDLKPQILILLGFIVFILIFFAEENLFTSAYFKIKKNVLKLKENNSICEDINFNDKKIVNYDKVRFSLTKEDLINIKDNIKKDFLINIKIKYPISIIIILNFIIYLFKIISFDKINIEILIFQFNFLLYSFVIGGIIAILMIIYFYFKNHKKIKIKFSKNERLIFYLSLGLIIILSLIKIKFIFLLLIISLYPMLKIAKEVEKFMFVKKKKLNQIVLGDWVCEDIKIKNKIIYSLEDFKLGINEIQLEKIKQLAKIDSKLNKLYVKDGIAFLPPLFIGFLIIILI